MNWLFDAHIHLSDPEYESDLPLIIESMNKQNIKACCVSMDVDTCQNTMKLSEQSENILPFLGIHPEKAQDDPTSVYDMIKENQTKIPVLVKLVLTGHTLALNMNGKYKRRFFQTNCL